MPYLTRPSQAAPGRTPFPSFVLGSKESSTDPWEGAGHGRLRVGRVKYRYASGFFLPAASLDNPFGAFRADLSILPNEDT